MQQWYDEFLWNFNWLSDRQQKLRDDLTSLFKKYQWRNYGFVVFKSPFKKGPNAMLTELRAAVRERTCNHIAT